MRGPGKGMGRGLLWRDDNARVIVRLMNFIFLRSYVIPHENEAQTTIYTSIKGKKNGEGTVKLSRQGYLGG